MVGKSGNTESWGRGSMPRWSIHALCLVPNPGLLFHRSVHLNYPAGRRMYISTSPGNRLLTFLIFPAITPIPSDALSGKNRHPRSKWNEVSGLAIFFIGMAMHYIYRAQVIVQSIRADSIHLFIHPSILPATSSYPLCHCGQEVCGGPLFRTYAADKISLFPRRSGF